MKVVTIEGTKREELGSKSAKQLRREGHVPCVIYGGKENIHFFTPETSFKELLYTAEAHTVEINVGGTATKAVIRDVQYHPVTDEVEHVDFFQLIPGVPVTIEVPINLIGNARGVRNGGRLKVNLRKLRVKASEENLPGKLDIDIEKLRIGQAIRVNEVKTDGFEIEHEPHRVILTIQNARNAVEDLEEEEEEGAEGEEGATEGAAAEGGEETTTTEA
ncbi:MAG: 50S ribosomal protein L25/general stress protein Ctc [Owenweeksia sp.]